ncbi:hypothetical protein BKA93DRAFT_903331 [Sparassis latifolia]|uniref:Uncharacterized protein n=1 Tax=Sparassis crispa TaxID=139825 RepID=A0A401H2C6_9APHY|nr:hypothetical protein SCP_1400100 [Sparassis crispa]GBE88606.1 hypothetical protein SCP_1400100 [Sparassis crispa]
MFATLPPTKRRRTATSVLGGDFDTRPARDALTSVLNGVPIYKAVEGSEEGRRGRKRKEKEKEKEKRRAKPGPKPGPKFLPPVASTSTAVPVGATASKRNPTLPKPITSSFWQARPTIHIATMQRSVSVTPPPMPSSPPTTPGPSISSATSATSSKRPHTPNDDEDLNSRQRSVASSTPPPREPRRKRPAVRKGWKGWVEGSPPPSEKLINLDVVTVLQERKTRSGKNFDAIGVGKEGWV